MPAHKHAALMALYAQDAAETTEPWLRWEAKGDGSNVNWMGLLTGHPDWLDTMAYRRKPRTIRIGEFDVPEPMRDAPAHRTDFFVVYLDSEDLYFLDSWVGTELDEQRLAKGLCHLTCEAARLHAKALLSLTSKEA